MIFREGILFLLKKNKRRWKRKIVFGEGIYISAGEKINSRGKGGKYVFLRRRRIMKKEKDDHLQEAGRS